MRIDSERHGFTFDQSLEKKTAVNFVLTVEIFDIHVMLRRQLVPISTMLLLNKPRTAKVGAISKAQNCKKGDPSGFVKLQLVAKYEKKIEGEPFGDSKEFQKKI